MKFYDYQIAGIEHNLSMPYGRPHALNADDPGAGKTAQCIGSNLAAGCKNGIIVTPASVKEQWRRQLIQWEMCDEDEIQVLYGRDAVLDNRPWKIINYDIVREKEIQKQFAAKQWDSLNLDEVHRVKTYSSKQTLGLLGLKNGLSAFCYWKWAFSGTITPNRPVELYALLRAWCPEVLDPYNNFELFKNRYCGGYWADGKGASNLDELYAKLSKFMLRRSLDDIWPDKPQLIEKEVWLDPSDMNLEAHPEWLGLGFMPEPTERRVIAECKVPAMARYILDRLQDGSGKLVLFCYHREVIDKLVSTLRACGTKGERIYGGLGDKKRREIFDNFCSLDWDWIVLQIGSGGEALDGLQHYAREYIQCEPEWSPGREDQAGARILRLGQTKTVISTKLLVDDSYEKIIFRSSKRKRRAIGIITKPNGGNFVMQQQLDPVTRQAQALESIAASLNVIVPLSEHLLEALKVGVGITNQQTPASAPQPPSPSPASYPSQYPAPGGPAFRNTAQAYPAPGQMPPPQPMQQVQQPSPFPQAPQAGYYPQPAAPGTPGLQQNPIGAPGAPNQFGYPQAPQQQNYSMPTDSGARKGFEDAIVAKLSNPDPATASANYAKLEQTLRQYGANKVGDLPEQSFGAFLAALG